MDVVGLSRLQFAVTTVYHFFFVPLTLGLSVLVAIMETQYARTGDETWLRMTKFWGKLFVINFVMGVVTGIVQEFQFGMNWSEYSRFMGDIFGAPLAIEALLAFYLESTFLGVWIFGWKKLSPKVHAGVMWLVAIGSNLSALWILIANSFMQHPVGYALRNERAEMTDFWALVGNSHVWLQWPHVLTASLATGGFFVLGISSWHLLRGNDSDGYRRSFKVGAGAAVVGIVLVMVIGHAQAQYLVEEQPLKLSAAEALWEDEDPAGLSLFAIPDVDGQRNIVDIKVPRLLSFLAYNRFSGQVKGIKTLQAEAEARWGPGDYTPPVWVNYWAFRIMVGAGGLMFLLAVAALWRIRKNTSPGGLLGRALVWAIAIPYVANTAGWIFTEMGRQPWIVYGLQRTADAVSPSVSLGEVGFSLIAFTVLYGVLMVVDVALLARFAKKGIDSGTDAPPVPAATA